MEQDDMQPAYLFVTNFVLPAWRWEEISVRSCSPPSKSRLECGDEASLLDRGPGAGDALVVIALAAAGSRPAT
jgi:hypothetical protein